MNRVDNYILNLLGVNISEVVSEYISGKYANVTVDNMPKIMTPKMVLNIIQEEVSSDFKHIKFVYRDPNNCRIIVQTSNSNTSDPNYKRLCNWHRGELEPNNRGICIPIDYKPKFVQSLGVTVHEFRSERLCCGFSCGIKAMRDSKRYTDQHEYLFRLLWDYCYPDVPFPREALDYDLLDINGGSMTIEEYTDPNQAVTLPITVRSCAAIKHYAMICN